MACNTCAKSFSLLRQEKGCPGCGFSYCSKCLNNKIFLKKLNTEAKVCVKCKKTAESGETSIDPPDAYYKRVGISDNVQNNDSKGNLPENSTDAKILERLQKLKQNEPSAKLAISDIEKRLQKLKGDIPTATDTELKLRLANIKGLPVSAVQSKPVVISADLRSEQEQVDDLLKQYMEQSNIDSNYKNEFDGVISNLETRLQKLKGVSTSGTQKEYTPDKDDSEDEATTIKKIIEKVKSEVEIDDTSIDSTIKELPFCEICNEDAKMRCRGCKYLFCKTCFMDHKDEDDGCNTYDPYTAE